MIRRLILPLALVALAAVSLAACGSSSSSSSSGSTASTPPASTTSTSGGGSAGGGSTVQISADPSGQLAFQQKSLTAKAGPVTVDFQNQSSTGHNVTVEDSSGKDLGATDTITGGSTTTTVDLKPGTYKFYCSVDSHEAAGMTGTLTVK